MPSLLPNLDPDGLLEYSVVYTDRSLNHMSQKFIGVMQETLAMLRTVYAANAVALVPGGGTYAMEAVARQLAGNAKVLIIRNGWFSYRWSQILETGGITAPENITVCQARQQDNSVQAPWQPAPLAEVLASIQAQQPKVVFAPHVETASGMLLPDDYLKEVADAVHAVGGLFVLDCIASGAVWVSMQSTGVDVLLTAPQKGWSATPCAGIVCLSERALEAIAASTSSSFALDLKKWLQIADAYVAGQASYHATLPTDGIVKLHAAMQETQDYGFENCRERQWLLGAQVRALLEERGFASVAAPGFQAPGVVVSYTDDAAIKSGQKFAKAGIQSAAGVPLMCGESADFSTFRLGLFGLDKLRNPDSAVTRLAQALAQF